MKVFIGLTEVSGYYRNLRRGLAELGVDAVVVDLNNHRFEYAAGERPNVLIRGGRLARRLQQSSTGRLLPLRVGLKGSEYAFRAALLGWAALRFDVFLFSFGETFLPAMRFVDIGLLRRLGKRVICQFVGSDSRPAYMDGFATTGRTPEAIGSCIRMAARQKDMIQAIEQSADMVIGFPLFDHFHERPVVSAACLGVPFHMNESEAAAVESEPPRPCSTDGTVRILHAPSHHAGKGTARIRAAVERVRECGHRIDFVEISGQPHRVVLRELRNCDFVIDQAYTDSPMGVFVSEAGYFGRPAIVAGYAKGVYERLYPPEFLPPVCYSHPDDLEQAIERMIVDVPYRAELGQRVQQLVRVRWAPARVAERFLKIFRGDVPLEWLHQPRDILYVHGSGLPEREGRLLVRDVIRTGTVGALQLADKPELERRFVEFAGGDGC